MFNPKSNGEIIREVATVVAWIVGIGIVSNLLVGTAEKLTGVTLAE